MKKIVFATTFVTQVAFAGAKTSHRFVFDFPETAGSIQKLQVDLKENKGKWKATTKALGYDGKSKSGSLSCTKLAPDDFECRREDGGGGFSLTLVPKPKLSIDHFTADGEADDTPSLMIRAAKEGAPVTVEGTKAAISPKDAF